MKIKKVFLPAVFSTLISGLIFPPLLHAKPGSLFREISSPSGKVYVLGSIHMADASIYPLPSAIENAFEKSDAVVVEANALSALSDAGILAGLQSRGYHTDGKTLRDDVPAAVYKSFEKACAASGLDMTMFDMMRPWLAALTLQAMDMLKSGFDPQYGIDVYFLQKAQGRKDIRELESMGYQLDLLSGLDNSLQSLFLESTVEESGRIKETMARLLALWKQGDAEALSDEALSSSSADKQKYAPLYRELVTKRNYRMAARIEELLKEQKTFFVIVGAGHVPGKDGIVEILRRKKYAVTQPQ